jgi:predicted phage tail protein
MMTIMLYGWLGKQFGRVHRKDVRTAAEAVKALRVTLPGFEKALREGGYFKVSYGGDEVLARDNLRDPLSAKRTLRIIPKIIGAGGGVFQVILGVVLIVVGAITTNPQLMLMGAAMALGGVAAMMAASPTAQQGQQDKTLPSYAFNGPVNTSQQGNPIPLCYGGPLRIGSQVLSAALTVQQVIVTPPAVAAPAVPPVGSQGGDAGSVSGGPGAGTWDGIGG